MYYIVNWCHIMTAYILICTGKIIGNFDLNKKKFFPPDMIGLLWSNLGIFLLRMFGVVCV